MCKNLDLVQVLKKKVLPDLNTPIKDQTISKNFQTILTARPTAKMVCVTKAIFFMSYKSVVWKRSTSGTPYLTQAFWNLEKKNP